MRCDSPKCTSCRGPRTFDEIMAATPAELSQAPLEQVQPHPALELPNLGCHGCSNCSDCSQCSICYGCCRCTSCTACTDCSDCYRCDRCDACIDCSDCYGIRGGQRVRYVVFGVQLAADQWREFRKHMERTP